MGLQQSVILFGGTFDPPHVGHFTMAQLALEQTGADAVWFLTSPDPPHKQHESHLDYPLRRRMVQAMLASAGASETRFVVSDLEALLPKPSYTIDTVRYCLDQYPSVAFQFLIGTDSLHDLPTWHEATELSRLIAFLVVPRHDYPYDTTLQEVRVHLPDLRTQFVDMPILDVSSTWIRSRHMAGKALCGLVSPDVMKLLNTGGR